MTQNAYLIFIGFIFSIIEIYLLVKFFNKKKYDYLITNIIVFLLMLLFLFYEYFFNVKINSIILTLVIVSIIGHSYGGEYLNLYYTSKIYDKALHLFGSFSSSLFVYSIIYNIIKPINYSKPYVSLFVLTLGVTLGVLFEIIEFTIDTLFKTKCQSSHKDTNLDLIFNVIGATLAGIISSYFFP